ncbi:hypothetical protein HY604_02955 [Candidatus Peregrinibacteria bacterium]|nr:hypothetical protein [Candidatus Peregrinibacteria bacterium]
MGNADVRGDDVAERVMRPTARPDGLEMRHVEDDIFVSFIDWCVKLWRSRIKKAAAISSEAGAQDGHLDTSNVPEGSAEPLPVDDTSAHKCAAQSEAVRAGIQNIGISDEYPPVPWWAKGIIDTEKNRIS